MVDVCRKPRADDDSREAYPQLVEIDSRGLGVDGRPRGHLVPEASSCRSEPAAFRSSETTASYTRLIT